MVEKLLLSQKLRELRKAKKITQKDLAIELSSFMGKDEKISPSAVCSWEKGEKKPTYETLLAFSDYYGVSTDYLLGKTTNKVFDNNIENLENYAKKITEDQLKENYNNKPVYLVSKDGSFADQWGIYNKENNRFYCVEHILYNSSSISYYALPPEALDNPNSKQNITLDEAKKYEQVWIEYKNPSHELRERFTGVYKVDCKNSIFIASNGFALPFEGIDITYHVYRRK